MQNFNFSNLLENSEIKRQPIGKCGNEKNSSSGKELEWGGASCRILAQKGVAV